MNHFSKTAEHYDEKRSKGILGKIVKKEEGLVLKYLDVQEGEDILDAGAGAGYYSQLIKERKGKAYSVDISAEMIQTLKKRGLEGEVADLEKLKLGKKFDKILCAGALEFLQEPEEALKRFKEHLKEGGVLVILYPRTSIGGQCYRTYHKLLHKIKIHLFAKEKIRGLLEKTGFQVLAQENAGINCAVIKAKKQ